MKKIVVIVTVLLFGLAFPSFGVQGYKIYLKVPGVKDSMVYLTHYFGKPLPNIYKKDSARFDRNGVAEFYSEDTAFLGGIYLMLLSDKQTYFEFLLKKGDDLSMTVDLKKLPGGVKYKNSPENERFQDYEEYLKTYSKGQDALKKEYAAARTQADTLAVRKKSAAASKELTAYRKDYISKYPGTLLSAIFGALLVPEVPEGVHYLADGKTRDSAFAYTYYKTHYWDGFDFQDDRLINTPILDARLEEYMKKWVVQWPDSIEHESDQLLKKTRGSKELFKYSLWWLTRYVEGSKVMGMDEAFVYLVENYYMKGDAYWLSNDDLTKYLDRAMKIAPNVIGNIAPDIKLKNVLTQKDETLMDVQAPYTLVVFYSPDCGHCQKELPEIDSLYQAVLKGKGVQVFTVATEGEQSKIAEFLEKDKLLQWTNTWDPDHVGDWRGKYDVYSTPTIYLLDDRKIIRGKKLDHTNILSVLEMQERKKAKK